MDGINDTQVDVGYFFDQPKPVWARNIFANRLEGAPFSEAVKRDLMKWRTTTGGSEEVRKRLDSITYKQYIEGELVARSSGPASAFAIGDRVFHRVHLWACYDLK